MAQKALWDRFVLCIFEQRWSITYVIISKWFKVQSLRQLIKSHSCSSFKQHAFRIGTAWYTVIMIIDLWSLRFFHLISVSKWLQIPNFNSTHICYIYIICRKSNDAFWRINNWTAYNNWIIPIHLGVLLNILHMWSRGSL